MRKSENASIPSLSVAAAQPITGGRAPGMAPIAVFRVVHGFSGV